MEDRQCLRRALGKLWNIELGQVRHKGKLKLESKDEWYDIVQKRPAHWHNIKHNVRTKCSRGEGGGGQNELKLWAYITQTTIIIVHKVCNQATVYTPDPHTLPEMKLASDLGMLHAKLKQDGKIPMHLM